MVNSLLINLAVKPHAKGVSFDYTGPIQVPEAIGSQLIPAVYSNYFFNFRHFNAL
jgi:hypothetical protein